MKHKLKIILLDLIYFLLVSIILILTRNITYGFLSDIQAFGGQLNAININEDLLEAQNLLSNLTSVTTKAYIFIFFIIPLIIFIIYIFLQGETLKKEKFSYKKFTLVSIIPFIFLILGLFIDSWFFILFLITSYIAFILYFYHYKKLNLAYKKIYKLFPMYLIYAILPLLILGFFYLAYTRIPISMDFIVIIIFAAIFSLIFSLYKIYLLKKLN